MASSSVNVTKRETKTSVNVCGDGNFVIAAGSNSRVNIGGTGISQSRSGKESTDCGTSQTSFRKVFLHIQKQCAKDWKAILRHLPWPEGMSDAELENEIDAISRDYQNDLKEQCYKGLCLWTEKYNDASMDKLVEALNDCDLSTVAEDVAKMDI